MSDNSDTNNHLYDVGLSFAGEQRSYVETVAQELRSRGIRCFYDDYEKTELWGKDLYAHLSEVYGHLCRYCVIFVSQDYDKKVWTNLERRAAQERALGEKREYILPVRFDDIEIPGLPSTIGYLDGSKLTPTELVGHIAAKVGVAIRKNYLPPELDRLYARMDAAEDETVKEVILHHAHRFFEVLGRMDEDERQAVIGLIRYGCPAELPNNVHINTDLLRRWTDLSEARLQRVLGQIGSLGFRCTIDKNRQHEADMPGEELGNSDFFYLNWWDLSDSRQPEALLVAHEMVICAIDHYCDVHGSEFLKRLDFSQLASSTVTFED